MSRGAIRPQPAFRRRATSRSTDGGISTYLRNVRVKCAWSAKPLLRAIVASGVQIDDSMLHQAYDERTQEQFGVEVTRAFGYDWQRGRQEQQVEPQRVTGRAVHGPSLHRPQEVDVIK